MKHITIFLVLFEVLAAGCSQGPGDEGNAPDPTMNPPAGNATKHLEFATGWLNSTRTSVSDGIGHTGIEGGNCAFFDFADLKRIDSGWANASWTSPSPLSDVMTLTVRGDLNTPKQEVEGRSPLSLQISNISSDERFDLSVYLYGMDVGADIKVDMHLYYEFQYEGTTPLTYVHGGCS